MNEHTLPLLYRAAKAGAYGARYEFESGSLTDALFIYLDGVPEEASVSALLRDCRGRGIVCLTQEWAKVLEDKCPHALRLTRWMMEPAREFDIPDVTVPEGFTLEDFDKAAFDRHPFSHGENYAHYMDFRLHGVGAVVRHEGEIVASASSFLSY